jgi:hypothetical protein
MLLLWLGICLTPVHTLFILVVGYKWAAHDPTLAKFTRQPVLFMVQSACWLLLSLILLAAGYKLAKGVGFVGWSGETALRRVFTAWVENVRVVLRPTVDDRLSDWIVDFERPYEEVKNQLEALPTIPRLPITELFLLESHAPASRVRGDKVILAARSRDIWTSLWYGTLSRDENGLATLRGRVGLGRSAPFVWFYSALLSVCLLLVVVMCVMAIVQSGISGLFVLIILIPLWLVARGQYLSLRRLLRRHERQLERLFRERLEAQAIYLTSRDEIFSVEKIKNFRQNR